MPLAMPSTKQVITVSVVAYVLWKLRAKGRVNKRKAYLKQRGDKKRAERDRKRTTDYAKLDFKSLPRGLEIVGMTVTQLVAAMEKGDLSSEEVVTAFCARAKDAGEELSTNAEECFLEAIEEAKKCDEERKAGTTRGPLHGVPVSIKDQIDMEGYDSTCGLACRVYQPAKKSSVLVTMLKDNGAIPFVRSNVPQCLMLPETFNAIWGTTGNPFDPSRTPGGSSGGEGALVACGGSPLGIGTDIGGSIRIPAAFCGVVGFKPTPQRISSRGVGVPRPGDSTGQNAVYSVAGPLTKTVDDAELVMQLWCNEGKSTSMWQVDPKVPKMMWDAGVAKSEKKLKFGVLREDGFFTPAPAQARALQVTVEGLRADGHEVVEIDFDLSQHAFLFLSMMSAEGSMKGFLDGLDGEELHENYAFLKKVSSMPSSLRWVVSKAYEMMGKARFSGIVGQARERSVYEFWELIKERDTLQKKFTQYLLGNEIEAVVCPGIGAPAFKHGMSSKLSLSCSYTYLWNHFHFPAGSVPVTYVKPDEQHYSSPHQDPLTQDACRNAEDTAGLPVTVQIVTTPYNDELCIKAMKDVETAVASSWQRPAFKADTVRIKQP